VTFAGFIVVGAPQQPALLVAVPVSIDVDPAVVTQPDRPVLDLLPLPVDFLLLYFDPGKQPVAALPDLAHRFLVGQPGAVIFCLAALRVRLGKDEETAAGISVEFEHHLAHIALMDEFGPAREECRQPARRNRPARQSQQLAVGHGI
jgi:hypothetical protein